MQSKGMIKKYTILSAGTHIQGEIFAEGTLVLEGRVEGRVVCRQAWVKNAGTIKGALSCHSLQIEEGGRIEGDLQVLKL